MSLNLGLSDLRVSAHNPKVAGSNPAPATKGPGQTPCLTRAVSRVGPLPARYRHHATVSSGSTGVMSRAKVLAASRCMPGSTCW